MSRFKRFAHSLLSGYVQLGANTLYTLASVAIALHYLGTAELGLFLLVSQVAGYVGLIDLGVAGVSRILIDYKDTKSGGEYGSVILTTLLVSAVQALIILLLGWALLPWFGPALGVPDLMQREFHWLMFGQCAILAFTFLSRIAMYLLNAHQRYDVVNYSQAFQFGVSLALLWGGFRLGWGIYSLLWGQAAAALGNAVVQLLWCFRLRLFPAAGCWGRPERRRFVEIFVYGKDIFLFTLGNLLVNASQTILVARVLGLEAGAIWSVCVRALTLLTQVISRVFDFSCATLAEMIVRQEFALLQLRFRSIVVLSCSLSVMAGIFLAVCNQPFVRLWSGGRITSEPINDVLLAISLVLTVLARCHLGLIGQAKEFGFLRYVYFLEGACFILSALAVLPRWGITGMLLCAIGGSLLFSVPYGLWRSARYFRESTFSVLFSWLQPSLLVGLAFAPLAGLIWWFTQPLPPLAQLLLRLALLAPAGLWLLLARGLDRPAQDELLRRMPARWRVRSLLAAREKI
jgi:O-antigen/teichoic acid export membrane protein